MTVFLDSGGVNWHACGAKGSIVDFEMRWSKCDRETALHNIAEITGANADGSGGQRFVSDHIYDNREGMPVSKKARYLKANGKKVCYWYCWNSVGNK